MSSDVNSEKSAAVSYTGSNATTTIFGGPPCPRCGAGHMNIMKWAGYWAKFCCCCGEEL